jgi:bacillithiol system protein YtxJ
MNWTEFNHPEQLNQIVEQSYIRDQVIFKHSTRCSISVLAKNRLERSVPPENVCFHYLDLLENRTVSNLVADHFEVIHASPQILMIRNGSCIYDESHQAITMEDINEQHEAR